MPFSAIWMQIEIIILSKGSEKEKYHAISLSWESSMPKHILLPCLFNLYAVYIMQNAGLDEGIQLEQAGIKIPGRNINNLRYADDTTLMAESEEELKNLLMKVKVE